MGNNSNSFTFFEKTSGFCPVTFSGNYRLRVPTVVCISRMLYFLYMQPSTIELTNGEKTFISTLPIQALILFGSQAQNTASKMSDYDVGVILRPHQSDQSRQRVYDAVYDLISQKVNKLVDIDIVFLYDTPLELQYHVIKYGIVLYERNNHPFVLYRESVLLQYADFAPLRQLFQEATLARIPS